MRLAVTQGRGNAPVWRGGQGAPAPQARRAEVERLAAGAAEGQRGALEGLCARIAKGVLARVRFLHSGGDAEDIAQEALMRMCERIHTLKDPGAFRAWMHSIVLNEVRQQQRRSGKYGRLLYLDEAPEELAEENEALQPHEYVLREEEARVIMEIIGDFPPRQREAVLLHYYDNMSVTDTARAMELTHQSVTRQLALAREKLRRELARRAGQPGGARLGALAPAPAGALITGAMRGLYGRFTPADALWARGAAAKALKWAAGKALPGAAAGIGATAKAALWPRIAAGVAGLAGAVVVAAAVLTPGGGARGTAQNPLPLPPQAQVAVVFTGGDETYEHLNPKTAAVHVANRQPYTPRGWAITARGGAAPLQSGAGGAVEAAALAQMPCGMYRLTFTLEDEARRVYTLACNFQIGYGPGI